MAYTIDRYPLRGLTAARGNDPATCAGVRASRPALVPKVHCSVQPGMLGRRLHADDLGAGDQRHPLWEVG